MITASDYLKSSNNPELCGTHKLNRTNYGTCKNTTWMYRSTEFWWTISPSSGASNRVLQLHDTGYLGYSQTTSKYAIYPSLYLSSGVTLVGEGTKNNPYQIISGIKLKNLNVPTFSEEKTDNGKTVTITYPEGEGLTYEYQKDGGGWIAASQVEKVEFTESGTLVAKVSDGTNEADSTYAVEIIKTGANQIVNTVDVVANGDGLYEDSVEENIYTYRGASPNNYVTFNGEKWRVISVNTNDNTIKIIGDNISLDTSYDVNGRRRSGYCYQKYQINAYGCNIWGSASTLYDNNMSPITELSPSVDGEKLPLPSTEATLNTYLNSTYYNDLRENAKQMIVEGIFKVGVLVHKEGQTLTEDINQVSATKWKGKVALIDATEYIRASTDNTCINLYESSQNCKNSNWMHNDINIMTLTPISATQSLIWGISSYGHLYDTDAHLRLDNSVRPVVTLSPEVKIASGNGSSSSPYQLTL